MVKVKVEPAEDGIHFAFGGERVAARAENVTDTTRCTRLGGISTIEHLMSAFAGLEITDADVLLSAPELPAAGGSAKFYFDQLRASGLVDLGEATVNLPYARLWHKDGNVEIAIGQGSGHWRYDFECGERWPHSQIFETLAVDKDYGMQIAPARTFDFAENIPKVIEWGLARGLDESSALILGIEGYKNEPVFPDEPARHKLLDLIGDLYLSGVPVKFLNVSAIRSGHRTNVEAAALLAQAVTASAPA
jgi:UDP-3-O-acyl-N-acetylglucosamine deacetylase